jgi:hypothetical protein
MLTLIPQKYFDNEQELKDMMEQLSSCLEEVNRGLLRSEDYGNDFVKSSEQLAKCVPYYTYFNLNLCLQADCGRGS